METLQPGTPSGPDDQPPDPAAAGQQARRYGNARFRLSIAAAICDFAALAAFLFSGASLRLARALPGGPAVVVLAYVTLLTLGLMLLDMPFGIWGRLIEIRFGMNRQGWGGWLWDEVKGSALGLGLGLAAAELVYALLRTAPHTWWLWSWAAFSLFTVVMAQLGPVLLLPLFFKLRQMSEDDPREAELLRRLHATYDKLRSENPRLPRLHGIYEWKLGAKTAKANAALTGLGGTRRVLISDTLLESSPAEEIEAVFAHELGHHVHGDIWRGIGFQGGLSLLGFWLAQRALARFGPALGLRGVADVAGLPLLVLVFTLLGLALMPASNGFVRAMERRADDYAFAALGSAQPLIAGLRRLAEKNLAEVDPPRWKELLLYSHPSIGTRVRRGQAWEARQRPGG